MGVRGPRVPARRSTQIGKAAVFRDQKLRVRIPPPAARGALVQRKNAWWRTKRSRVRVLHVPVDRDPPGWTNWKSRRHERSELCGFESRPRYRKRVLTEVRQLEARPSSNLGACGFDPRSRYSICKTARTHARGGISGGFRRRRARFAPSVDASWRIPRIRPIESILLDEFVNF